MWRGSARPPLADSLNAKLFGLYLQGKNTEEIRRLNQALTLGDIVQAKVAGAWDARRDEHLQRLLAETSVRVAQSTLETADFLCDMMAVAAKQYGDRFKRYLQTGDEKELGDFKIDSLFQLKQAIEALQKLTGQERQTSVHHSGAVQVAAARRRAPTSLEAAAGLQLLAGGKK